MTDLLQPFTTLEWLFRAWSSGPELKTFANQKFFLVPHRKTVCLFVCQGKQKFFFQMKYDSSLAIIVPFGVRLKDGDFKDSDSKPVTQRRWLKVADLKVADYQARPAIRKSSRLCWSQSNLSVICETRQCYIMLDGSDIMLDCVTWRRKAVDWASDVGALIKLWLHTAVPAITSGHLSFSRLSRLAVAVCRWKGVKNLIFSTLEQERD